MGVSWVEQQPDAILQGEEVNDLNPCDSKNGTLGNTRMDVQHLWGNTCGETLVGNTPKIRCLQAGHSQALINPAQ